MRATSLGHAGILIETGDVRLVCDPWFSPAFLASWFPFPRNDRLPARVREALERPTHLYVSHLHGDHFDETYLARHVDRDATVVLPEYPTRELERRLAALGFTRVLRTRNGEPTELAPGVGVAIHVETSITDGPGGDSALVVWDDDARLVNQNDCRTGDLAALRAHGPVDQHWLQYSGAIWYPMVYELPDEERAALARAKVESQYARAMRYVEAVDAAAVVPSAGPPCFLDDDLWGLNAVTGDEATIFPDQRGFLARLDDAGRRGLLAIPGSCVESRGGETRVTHPCDDAEVGRIFARKDEYLREYQRDVRPLIEAERATWPTATTDVVAAMRAWMEPLMALAPTLCRAIGAPCVVRSGGDAVLLDFPAGRVRRWDGEDHAFRLEIPRPLLERVVADHAVDWSNSLFLSCRFRAWRRGQFNEWLYSFFKSLSVERMSRTEDEARRRTGTVPPDESDVRIGDWIVQRRCPHREADLSVFGEIDGDELVCTLHGWRFDLATGRCRTADDRPLRVRRAD